MSASARPIWSPTRPARPSAPSGFPSPGPGPRAAQALLGLLADGAHRQVQPIADEDQLGLHGAAFRQRAADEFRRRANEASVIMVSHDPGTLRRFCTAGLLISGGKAHWFDKLDDALTAYKETVPK